jgi:predicted nucleic acid-binding protein
MTARKTSSTAFFDTSAFIPLLDPEKSLHARILQHVNERDAFVSIDTVVLSEFLVGIPDASAADAFVKSCTKQFRIHTFDIQTASVCAALFQVLKAKGQVPRTQADRQLTKVDAMVLASAIVSGADEFLFEDGCFAAWPALLDNPFCGFRLPEFVRVSGLPPVEIQGELSMGGSPEG